MRILLTILLCFSMATPCFAKKAKKCKSDFVSSDTNTFLWVKVDDTVNWNNVGIPGTPEKNDKFNLVIDDVVDEGDGQKSIGFSLKKVN